MKNAFLIFLLLSTISLNSQSLNIDETIDYINNFYKNTDSDTRIALEKTGNLRIEENYSGWSYIMDINNVRIKPSYFRKGSFELGCKKYGEECIEIKVSTGPRQQPTNSKFLHTNASLYEKEKLANAYKYLINLASTSEEYKRKDNDPFAPSNFNDSSYQIKKSGNSDEIQLKKSNGVYSVNLIFGKFEYEFILDSGASDLSISEEIEGKLISNKIISKDMYIEPGLYRIANGEIVQCRRLIIPEIKIGNYTVKSVRTSVGLGDTPLLLGKSFLDKFSSWSIDNLSQTLKLKI